MIFVDTSFFFPLLSAHDRDHERVRAVFESLRGRRLPDLLLTTNHVVGETITLARARGDHALAVHAVSISTARRSHASTGRHPNRSEQPSPTSRSTTTSTTASSTA